MKHFKIIFYPSVVLNIELIVLFISVVNNSLKDPLDQIVFEKLNPETRDFKFKHMHMLRSTYERVVIMYE